MSVQYFSQVKRNRLKLEKVGVYWHIESEGEVNAYALTGTQ